MIFSERSHPPTGKTRALSPANVFSGSVATEPRWGGKLCRHLEARIIRRLCANNYENRFKLLQVEEENQGNAILRHGGLAMASRESISTPVRAATGLLSRWYAISRVFFYLQAWLCEKSLCGERSTECKIIDTRDWTTNIRWLPVGL